MMQFIYNFFLALSQFNNTLLLGDPDESISGRLGRAYLSGKPKWWVEPWMHAVDWVFVAFLGELNHCVESVEYTEAHDKELWSWIKGE
jgi:hypothetical protein